MGIDGSAHALEAKRAGWKNKVFKPDCMLGPPYRLMPEWCNGRLVVAGGASEVIRFRRLVGVGVTGQPLTPLTCKEDARASQVRSCDEDGREHFRRVSRSCPDLRFVYVYGYDAEINAEEELMDLAQAHWAKWLTRRDLP